MHARRFGKSRSVCRHPAGKPVPESMRAVALAWAEGRSGYLRFARDRVQLIHGEPADERQLQDLVFALYEADTPRFIDATVPGKPVPPALPYELWTAAKRLVDRGDLKGKARGRLVPGPVFSRLAAFPMCSQTRRLLTRADQRKVRLGDTVRFEREVRMQVLDEVCALIVLDVVRLQAPVARPARPARTRAPVAQVEVKVDAATARRILREVEQLADADDWTVLGCSPSMPKERVVQAAERMLARYTAYASHPRLAGEAQDAARRIVARVDRALTNVQRGKASRTGSTLTPAIAFPEGKAQVEQGEFANAVKCFAVAHQAEPMSAKNMAWLGFALYFDETRPITSRQGKGRRFLDKALQMGTCPGDANYLMAKVLYADGELVRAWNHLDAALRAEPTHRAARELHTTIQREIRRV